MKKTITLLKFIAAILTASSLNTSYAAVPNQGEVSQEIANTIRSGSGAIFHKKKRFLGGVDTINLEAYFPKQDTTAKLRVSNGRLQAVYHYLSKRDDFNRLYASHFNMKKPGSLKIWGKSYGEGQRMATYANLFFGNDKSVTEVGDWYNYGAAFGPFGYLTTDTQKPGGLAWAEPGGLRRRDKQFFVSTNTVHPYNQYQKTLDQKTGQLAYTYVLAEKVGKFKPLYGRKGGEWTTKHNKEYNNVVRLLFYHGTNTGNTSVNCSKTTGNELKALYSKVPGFNSYVSEYYLAPDKWIVQERTLYVEDAEYWRKTGLNMPNCWGAAFDTSTDPSRQASFIDE